MIHMVYILPMLLGRTFDAKRDLVGVDIFPEEDVQNPKTIVETWSQSTYKTVESSTDVKNILGVSGDLSLKIKTDVLDFKGMGSYLKDAVATDNAVDVLFKVTYRTYSTSVPLSAKPIANWLEIAKEFRGTHYVHSVIYGGDLVARVRFKALKAEYLNEIRAKIKGSLSGGTAIQVVGEGQLDKLKEDLKDMANIEISYFANVPIRSVPNDIEGLKKLVSEFEDQVKKVNNGWGVPVEVDLKDLSDIGGRTEFLKNAVLDSELTLFEEELDDLLSTKSKLKSWYSALPDNIPSEFITRVDDLLTRTTKTIRVFIEIINKLDVTEDSDQLQVAHDAYENNGDGFLLGKYSRELYGLIEEMAPELEKTATRGSSTYVKYGSKSCGTSNGTTIIFTGNMAGSKVGVKGSGINYMCLPDEPVYEEIRKSDVDTSKSSEVSGVRYAILPMEVLGKKVDTSLEGVICSYCAVEGRPTVSTFYDIDCPQDSGWTREYSGYIMSTGSVNRAEYICVDHTLEGTADTEIADSDQKLNPIKIRRASDTSSGTDSIYLPCTVCTK